jgi:hypothetical protein
MVAPTMSITPVRSTVAAALLTLSAAAADAQLVRGVALDSTSGFPLQEATVRLVSASGRTMAAALVDGRGNFVLRTRTSGRYRVRLQRIGHRLTHSAPFDLARGDTVMLRLAVVAAPVTLSAVEVTGRARCVLDAAERDRVSLLWNEARKALEAEQLTRDTRAVRMQVEDRERELDPHTQASRGQRVSRREGIALQAYPAPPPAQLAERGYVQALGGETRFHAPDADALLSESFEQTHCFRLAADSTQPALVGVGFEPDTSQRVPDVHGTLWLDRASFELRALDYGYVGVPAQLPADAAGGRVEYRRLPAGRWIVSRWTARAPVLERVSRSRASRVEESRVVAIREMEGEVIAAELAGAPVWSSGRSALQAVVVEGATGRPAAGVRVALDGTPFVATSDGAGRLRIADVPTGRYDMSLTLPGPPVLALPRVGSLEVGASRVARIVVPTADSVAALLCPAPRADGTTVLTGTASLGSPRAPLRNVSLTFRWRRMSSASASEVVGREEELRVSTDDAGRYRACGVPADARMSAAPATASGAAPRMELRTGAGPLTVLDLVLPEAPGGR